MRSRRVPDRLADILQAIDNLRSDIGTLAQTEFIADGKTQRAVVESLIVIGEAANHIMRMEPTLEATQPELWLQLRDAYDMRIVLTHEYFRIDPALVWQTVQNDLPAFEHLLRNWPPCLA